MKQSIVKRYKKFLGFPPDKKVVHSVWKDKEGMQHHCLSFLSLPRKLPKIFNPITTGSIFELEEFVENTLDYHYGKTRLDKFNMDDGTVKMKVKVTFYLLHQEVRMSDET